MTDDTISGAPEWNEWVKNLKSKMDQSPEVVVLGTVTTSQTMFDKYKKWLKQQNALAVELQKKTVEDAHYDTYGFSWEQGEPYVGPIGGCITYEVTPTSIGDSIWAIHAVTKERFDLTEYSWW